MGERRLTIPSSGPAYGGPLKSNVKAHMGNFSSPWCLMTRRKLFGIAAFVLAMFIAIAALGQIWIKSPEPYGLGRAAVGSRLSVPATAVELKRLAPFQFADGNFSGEALFVLCAADARCFTVVAKKRDARWSVVDLVER